METPLSNRGHGAMSGYGAGYSEAPLDLLRGLGVDTSGVTISSRSAFWTR